MSPSELLAAYLPMDRRWALLTGSPLPERSEGAVLFADIRGFTQLGEDLTRRLGPWQGAEDLNRQISACFADLIVAVHTFRGSVTRFSGDGLLAVFTGEDGPSTRATAAAQAIQEAMQRHPSLSLRVGLGAGPIRRRLLGDPIHGVYDLLSGPAQDQAIAAMEQAAPGGIAGAIAIQLAPPSPWPERSWNDLPEEALRPWIPPEIYRRLSDGAIAFVAELRQVVPLFAQVLCPEDALPAYITHIQAVLARSGVRLNEVEILDKGIILVAFFGAPVARGDDPVRAVGAALAIMEAGRSQKTLFAQRIGMSIGPLYAGLVGSPDRLTYTLYGDEMNVSARLMQASQPWEIMASIRLCRAAEKRYHFFLLGDIPVKGRKDPVRVTRVEGERQYLLPSNEGPLVGRRRERALLDDIIAAVWAGHSRILVINGEAGIGKSRLAMALLQQWQEREGQACLGQAQATAREQSYLAWSELLGQLFQLRGDEEDILRLEEKVAAIDPNLLPRLPLLGDVLQLPIADNALTRSFDARLRQASTQALVVDLLRPQQDPLLLLIEDVHWLDGPSWALILTVVRGLTGRPALLCLTTRPMEPPPSALRQLSTMPAFDEILLGAFSPEEAVELARTRMQADHLPADLLSFLQTKGQGNPFFIEEILHTLEEEGFMQRNEGQVAIVRPLEQAQLPDNIQGVVLARIDRLEEPSRLTLKVASVIGRVFEHPVIREVHPNLAGQDTPLQQQLEQLSVLDIVLRERALPEPTYIFKHAITHEVAYSTLLFSQRRDLHSRIARYYENRYGGRLEPHYALLAYHYGRSDDEERQSHYCELAGQSAARRYANAEAISFYTQALEILSRQAGALQGKTLQENRLRRWKLLEQREPLFNRTAQREEQSADIEAMHALAREIGRPELELEALQRRAHLFYIIDDYDRAIQMLEQSLQQAHELDRPTIAGKSLRMLGRIGQRRGHYREALRAYQRACELFQEQGDEAGLADMLNPMGLVYTGLMAYGQAVATFEQALEIHRRTGNYHGEMHALGNMGFVQWDCGQYEHALEKLFRVLTMARQMGSRHDEAMTLHNIGDLYRYMGQYAEAVEYLQQAIPVAEEIHGPSLKGECLNNIGRVCLEQGRFAEAIEYLLQALQIREELEEIGPTVLDLSFLAWAYLGLGDLEPALEHSLRALELRHSSDVTVDWEQQVHFNHYRICQAAGLPEQAAAALERAYHVMHALAETMSEEGRRSFLEDVRVNREIAAAWEAYQP